MCLHDGLRDQLNFAIRLLLNNAKQGEFLKLRFALTALSLSGSPNQPCSDTHFF